MHHPHFENLLTCILLASLGILCCGLRAAETPAEWPQFHGPHRDNISTEKGLLKQWPKAGPPLVWKNVNCGAGYSGVAIADGMIFCAGDFGDEEMLFALNLEGKLLWETPNGTAWQGPTPGSRTTPTYDHGVLYHMNPTGRVTAVEARTGKPKWAVDLKAQFGARYGVWAMSENLVVEGDKVLCLPGGSKAFAVALDKHTGKTVWTNTELKERAAYCTPIVAAHRGVRQLITLSEKSAVSMDIASGKLLWSHPFGRVWQNTTSPVFHDGYVFVTCGHSAGGRLLKINPDQRGVTQVWHREEFDNCHGGVILLAGRLYGCGCRLGGKDFFCVDFLTGETKFSSSALGKVSITYADGMFYCLSDKGRMSLAAVTPTGLSVVSQFDLPKQTDLSLCHPVVCGGRLYVRHDKNLYVYDVRQDPQSK